MNFKTKGVVLQQKLYLENIKYLNILTPKNGILNVKLGLNVQITKNIFANVNIAGFYQFNLFAGRFGVIVDNIEEIEQFFKLRLFPEKLALAQYFCELSYLLGLPLQKASKQLKLLLNSIWILEKKSCFDLKLVKAIFELKLLSYSGYMPNLVCCKFCCSYEKDVMFFNNFKFFLICKDCLNKAYCENKDLIFLTKAVLHAMRFILYKNDMDIFKFKLEEKHLEMLCFIVENVVLQFIEKEPLTLQIYKQFDEEF